MLEHNRKPKVFTVGVGLAETDANTRKKIGNVVLNVMVVTV
jgi:hypothetical protein